MFINEDPIKDGLNWYSYCGGNPIGFVDPLGLADVPTTGTKALNILIDKLMQLIEVKVEYANATGDSSKETTAQKEARKKADNIRAEIDVNEIKEYSPKLAKIVNDNIVNDNSSVQQVSALLALYVEIRAYITEPNGLNVGDEVIPENKIMDKYKYYVDTGDIFLAGNSNDISVGDRRFAVRKEIIPKGKAQTYKQDTFVGDSIFGYWVRVIYYDKYVNDPGNDFGQESENIYDPQNKLS